jgi:tetratricopeptide (TPR) repeat protein
LAGAAAWPLVIVALGIAAYAGGMHGTWVFDDFPAIKDNPHVRQLSGVGQASWGMPQSPLSRRPVVALSVALNYAWGRYDVYGYHVVNLALHLVSALLLFGIVRRTCNGPVLRKRFSNCGRLLAAIVALVWVVHPLNSEAVMYITQRTTLLASMFVLATIYAALRAWQSSQPRRWQTVAVVCCALSLASKECGVLLPLLVPLLDRAFFVSSWRAAWQQRRTLYLGLAACESLLALLFAVGPDCESIGLDTGITPWQYLLTESGVLLHYVRLTVWPRPLVLAYDWQPVQAWTDAIATGPAVLTLLLATFWLVVRRPAIGFFGAWFFLLLAPTSSVVPIATELLAERRMYLASLALIVPAVAGAVLSVAWIAGRLPRGAAKFGVLGLPPAIAVAVLVLCAWLTHARVGDYRDEFTIWSDTVAKCPNNPVSQNNLGVALSESGHYPEAIEHLRFALTMHPNPVEGDAHNNLGSASFNLGDLAAARREFRLALKINPDDPKAHSNLALALATEGDYGKADAHSRKSLELDPHHVNGRLNRGFVLSRLRRIDEAAEQYRVAVELDPDNFLSHFNLGLALNELGRPAEALEHFQIASRLNPLDPRIHYTLGRLLLSHGHVAEARQHLQATLQLDPQHKPAQATLRQIAMRLANE